jgi:predicted SAM-dependent methyltransferase
MWPFKRRAGLPSLAGPVRLHIGCGENIYRGWVNIDRAPLRGVDQALDVRLGLPFEDVAAIYAEHFLEHLSLDHGLLFLRECRRVLASDGVLRVSTPNLDWVMRTHYRFDPIPDGEAQLECVRINRAFHGWGHQFLYNGPMLARALTAVGFEAVKFHAYGESDLPEMRGLERHEKVQDAPGLPHVLIAEAFGDADPKELEESFLHEYRMAIATH